MTRTRLWMAGVVVLLVALGVWISRNTYWVEVPMPMPPRGEALTNPFYAAQRFTEALGARATRDRLFIEPPPNAVIVLGSWRWSLSASRQQQLERWVASGGRLVVDVTNGLGDEAFVRWSGIARTNTDEDDSDSDEAEDEGVESEDEADAPSLFGPTTPSDTCRPYREERDEAFGPMPATSRTMCDVDADYVLSTTRPVMWMLRDDMGGAQAVRVAIGQGSVTVINTSPFRRRALFDGEHGWLFAAATQLRRGDDVHFLSEEAHPTLLAYIWAHGGAVIVLGLAIVVGLLWRGAVRFGPLAASAIAARRSLAEQIRGTGQFALRHGGGDALHAAAVRALGEAARRRLKGYGDLNDGDRALALSKLTGVNAKALAAALHPLAGKSQELLRAITRLETARRHIIDADTRLSRRRRPDSTAAPAEDSRRQNGDTANGTR